jgi:GxxExxY protein
VNTATEAKATNPTSYPFSDLTDKIIGSAITVHRELGQGFLERIYESALVLELRERGLRLERQHAFGVLYKRQLVGQYVADLVVDEKVICEIKAVDDLSSAHASQLLNYLKATRLPLGLLLNFGRDRLQVKRLINNPPRSQAPQRPL